MFKDRILVGIDFSQGCAHALREAVRIAGFRSTYVEILHVIDRRVLEDLEDKVVVDVARTLNEAQKRLEEFVAKHGQGYENVRLRVVLGHPFKELISTMNRVKVDLVVLGTRGTSDDPHRLGALASKCLRRAPSPILLVDDRKSEPIKKVMCAVDYSDTSKKAAKFAIHIATLEKARLEFIHVFIPPTSFHSPETGLMLVGFEGMADYPKQDRKALAAFVEPLLEGQTLDHEVTYTAVDDASVGRGIIKKINEHGCDLLVMGTHGRTGWNRLLLGTTAEHIFHRVPCSTLAVKPDEFSFGEEDC